jgi:hypothetical protein
MEEHDDTGTKDPEQREETIRDLDVPEEDAEDVAGGALYPHKPAGK